MLKRKVVVVSICVLLLFACLPWTSFVHATVLFSDGQLGSAMEMAGDFSAWTGTSIQAGYTLEVSTDRAHHGINSIKYIFANGGWPRNIYAYKTLVAPNPVYARCVLYIASESVTDGDGNGLFGFRQSGSLAWLLVKKSGSDLILRLRYWDTDVGNYVSVDSTTTLAKTTSITLELELEVGATGSIHVWKDGVAVNDLTIASVNNSGFTADDFFAGSTGNQITGNTNTMTYYIDCIDVSDAYIGPESADNPENVSVTLNSPADASTVTSWVQSFNFTPILVGSDSFQNATLWVNNTAVAYNSAAISNNTQNTIVYNFTENGVYFWNVEVWNSTSGVLADANFTLTVNYTADSFTVDDAVGLAVALPIVVLGVCVALIFSQRRRRES